MLLAVMGWYMSFCGTHCLCTTKSISTASFGIMWDFLTPNQTVLLISYISNVVPWNSISFHHIIKGQKLKTEFFDVEFKVTKAGHKTLTWALMWSLKTIIYGGFHCCLNHCLNSISYKLHARILHVVLWFCLNWYIIHGCQRIQGKTLK